ncbi:MAG: hypothetical protein ABSA01_06970 [Anaerolineales bacterium]|jgi:PhnB protein
MHAELNAGESLLFFASDTLARNEFRPGTNISMSLTGENDAGPRTYFQKLSAGGKITMPIEKAVWGTRLACARMNSVSTGW